MRAFIAITIPEDCASELSACQQLLNGAKFSLPKSFHITLKFLGDIDDAVLENTKRVLANLKFSEFECSFAGIGAFPNMNNPRVLWIGAEPAERICRMQREIDSSLQNIFQENSKFTPHITLARIKHIVSKEELNASLNSLMQPQSKFRVLSFELIKSALAPAGPIYETLCSYSLLE